MPTSPQDRVFRGRTVVVLIQGLNGAGPSHPIGPAGDWRDPNNAIDGLERKVCLVRSMRMLVL